MKPFLSAFSLQPSALEKWLPDMDLNHDKQIQSLLCYRYTIGQAGASNRLNAFPGQSSQQTAVPEGRTTIARGFNRGLAVALESSPAGTKEMCVFDAHPHPGPLPRGEGEATRASRTPGCHNCNHRPAFIRPGNRTITCACRIASKRRMILPLLGERAGVRAVVTTDFPVSRITSTLRSIATENGHHASRHHA
jgi:hypothetical protein